MKQFFSVLGLLLASSLLQAQEYEDHRDFASYSVYFMVFNSTFLSPEIAGPLGIKRSAYESLLNISFAKKGAYGALPGRVSGKARNLLGQESLLKFLEIREQDATYYIAPIRVSGKEILHFDIEVLPENESETLKLTFTKTVYSDQAN